MILCLLYNDGEQTTKDVQVLVVVVWDHRNRFYTRCRMQILQESGIPFLLNDGKEREARL